MTTERGEVTERMSGLRHRVRLWSGGRRISVKSEAREVRNERPSTTEQHVARKDHRKALGTHGRSHHSGGIGLSSWESTEFRALTNRPVDLGPRSLARVLDMASRSFNRKTARDEVWRLIGSHEPSAIIGSDEDQSRKCRMKDGDRKGLLYELHQAHTACGRYLM